VLLQLGRGICYGDTNMAYNNAEKSKLERNCEYVEQLRLEAALEIGLQETFPGSDPVAVTQPRRAFTQLAIPVGSIHRAKASKSL